MPISVPGPADRQRGFTLLEMMIVVVIIGIATGMASLSAFGNTADQALRKDAARLAQLFTTAQVEARASGQAIVWQHDAEGYRFVRLPRKLILPARLAARGNATQEQGWTDQAVLRPRAWSSEQPVSIRMEPGDRLVFGPEWISRPLKMQLNSGAHTVHLARLGNGRFVIEHD